MLGHQSCRKHLPPVHFDFQANRRELVVVGIAGHCPWLIVSRWCGVLSAGALMWSLGGEKGDYPGPPEVHGPGREGQVPGRQRR